MSISNYLENKILDKVLKDTAFTTAPVFIALHTADPGETGANEVSGGSYARQQVAAAGWNAAAAGLADNAGVVNFTGMPVVAAPGVVAVSLWDALSGGNCLWAGFLGTVVHPFTATDLTTEALVAPAHGFVLDDRVAFEAEDGGTLPTGLTAGTLYWVISPTANDFKVSTTQGGSAVNLTAVGSGKVRMVASKIIANAGDTFQIGAGDLDLVLF
jgi:hypothetical protein